jgi:hypothetical protein
MMTGIGVLLGTAAYMSPEQAKGKAADKRSDIWAFGCVLYEMLTGRRAFEGQDIPDTLANILKTQPDWHALPSNTPASIRRLLRRCLAKERRSRVADASIALIEIDEAHEEPADAGRESRTGFQSRAHVMWAAAAAALAVTAATLVWLLRANPAQPELRLSIETPQAMDATSLAISPDGGQVVFEAISDGRPRLWVRAMSSPSARPLPRTENAHGPFWSPDGRSIAFFADGKLKRIDLQGGTVQTLADATSGDGGTWNRDDVILFVPNRFSPLLRLAASGGTPAEVPNFSAKQGLRDLSHPQFLPDGTHFVVASQRRGAGVVEIYGGALDGSPPRHLFDTDAAPTAYAAGRLFFIRQGTLFAQRFDQSTLTFVDNPVPWPRG